MFTKNYFEDGSTGDGYDDYGSLEAGLRRTFEKRLAKILRAAPCYRNCLEIGSAFGFFLDELVKNGKDGTGVEVCEYAVHYAREHLGLHVLQGQLEDISFPSGSFDIACMWDVIEHLADPVVTLQSVHRVLAPDGMLFLTTGDVSSLVAKISGKRWHLYTLPDHQYFFNPKSIATILARSGFAVYGSTYDALHVPISYIYERIAKTAGFHLPFVKKCQAVIPVNLYDVMFVCARKV